MQCIVNSTQWAKKWKNSLMKNVCKIARSLESGGKIPWNRQFHLEGETRYNKFPKKWDFHKNKNRHYCHFLAQNWGNLAADYEAYGQT